ncbi:unnamed protein product [Lactuca virosa]|uniref:NAD(P)-binding protein n=1 Tax=Lactuca virosa TaxID=75947 RepID=A0AAU9PLZ1_9ASTR|nr:unnamed protein product [Lactuca virosa]
MPVRNVELGQKVKASICEKIPNAKIDVMELDLSSHASVRDFASQYISKDLPLNILILNAGIMSPPFTLSKDNIELQFATNHIGHFLLTNLLLDTMKKTSSKTQKEGRIVVVSSELQKMAYPEGIRFDKINDEKSYSAFHAYGQSKLANSLHAKEISSKIAFSLLKNIPQGAATTCYVAMHPQVKGVSGEYFADCNISKASKYVDDSEMVKKLWDFSLELTESK